MRIAISGEGIFYEIRSNYAYGITERIITVVEAEIVNPPTDIIKSSTTIRVEESPLIFREDYFDPTTRIRRGRLYRRDNSNPENNWSMTPNKNNGTWTNLLLEKTSSGSTQAILNTFTAYALSPYSLEAKKGTILLGSNEFKTKWDIIAIEKLHTREELLTLKATYSLSKLPNINYTAINPADENAITRLKKEYDSLINDLNALPESVVDHCRDVATTLLTIKLRAAFGMDLEDLVAEFAKQFPKDFINVQNAATIINRFHPRRKPNESEKRNLRELTYEDSEACISLIGLMVRDLNWKL